MSWWNKLRNAINSGVKNVWGYVVQEVGRQLIEIVLEQAICYFTGCC